MRGQFVQCRDIARFVEEIRQLLGDRRPDADDVAKRAACLGADDGGRDHAGAPFLERAVMPRQQPSVRLADPANAKRINHPFQRDVPPCLDRAGQIAGRQFAPAFAAGDLRLAFRQPEQIRRAVQPARFVKFADRFFAQSVDVERRARNEMDQPFDALFGANQSAGAAPHHLSRRPHRMAAAYRAGFRIHERHRVRRPAFHHHGNDLRDHVARALQHDGIADPNVLASDFVLVVQRRARDQHAADIDRLQLGDRRQRAGASNLDANAQQHGRRLLGGELPGDRPTRRAADEAEPSLQAQIVDFVDHAIDVVVQTGS